LPTKNGRLVIIQRMSMKNREITGSHDVNAAGERKAQKKGGEGGALVKKKLQSEGDIFGALRGTTLGPWTEWRAT